MSSAPVVIEDRRPDELVRSDDQDDLEHEPDQDAGAWPEEMGDVNFYADTSLTIPGQSAPPGDCGTWQPREFCNVCGEPVIGPKQCKRRICEDCWLIWRADRAAAITRRLSGARRDAEGSEKRLTHTVASPPEGEIKTLVEFEQAKKQAYELAKEKGIRGGVLIPHGWRIKGETKREYRALKDAGEVDCGIWQWVRENERDWRSQTYWSPHFHILGVGADVGASDPENDDGWVFSRIDSFDRFTINDTDSYEGVFRAASYLLSHVAFEPDNGKQAVRWFGELANNQFSLEGDLEDWERKVIDRMVSEVAEKPVDGNDEGGNKECPEDECDGALSPIWKAGEALSDPGWSDRIGRETEHRLAVAFEWAIGDRQPPPGLKFPQTEEEAEEAFEMLL